MCFGMGCQYEDSRGECKRKGGYPPADAACMEGESDALREDDFGGLFDDDDDAEGTQTLDELIESAVQLQREITARQEELKAVKAELEKFCDYPEGKNTAHIFGAGYNVTVQRKSNTAWDQKKLEAVRKAMGNENFFKIFSWEFKPAGAKQLNAYMDFGDPAIIDMINGARTVKPGAAQFTFTPWQQGGEA